MSLRSGNFAILIPYVVIAFLLLLIAAQLAKLTWTMFDSDTAVLGQGVAAVTTRKMPGVTAIDWNSIELFGKADVVKKAAVIKPKIKRPKIPGALQKLDITLIGVMLSSRPQNSYISIREKGDTRVLKNGAEIKDGVVVKVIRSRSFVASDGSTEKIFYLIPSDQLRAKDREAGLPQEKEEQEDRAPFTESQDVATISHQVDEKTKLKLAQYRQELAENPLSLVDKVKVSPVQRDGALYGYRLRHGKDRELLTSVGLRAGDILLDVNGLPITDPEQLSDVMESLASGSMINMKIERGGRTRDLNVVVE
jgi:general secretion pathway protein C